MAEIKYLKICELNEYIKSIIDNNDFLSRVYLKGEISNFKNHSTGHLYFTLKDETSRINAIMFGSKASKLNFVPEDGMNVLVMGRISVYPAQGTYQIYVEDMTIDGLGALYIEYEKLKKKLAQEGLFNREYKKPLPKYPNRIGVITAPTGAAVRDIMSTIKRRYPLCEAILFPALVQGKEAAKDIVRQLERADKYKVDVIILGRGGGSIEDLWAFNEEIVARAIFACHTPTISAVGHEIDWTISDFVADLRAPTPTGAAEMAVPTVLDLNNILANYKIRLNKFIKNLINTKFISFKNLKNNRILKNPLIMYEIKTQKLDNLIETLNNIVKNIITLKKNKYELLVTALKFVSPLGILEKGYSLVKFNDNIIKSNKEVKKGDLINIKLYEGEIQAKVTESN